MSNPKSDIPAKEAFAHQLKKRGYTEIRITRTPSDITAVRNGEVHYFEIKYTSAAKDYWGAATLTEWEAALEHSARHRFVVAYRNQSDWEFMEYTPAEFMQFSTIPPFKIFFRLPIRDGKALPSGRPTAAVRLTEEKFRAMLTLFKQFRRQTSLSLEQLNGSRETNGR